MLDDITVSSMLNSLVPISRFNKGEANRIFDEVHSSGFKIVVKNNKPTCVLLTPEKYEEMVETIENYHLFIEAEKRMKLAEENEFISHEQIMSNLNIKQDELEDIEVEIG
ncbi:MAG TPA: type II toxin-antitoxin system Phd/YefM family antitoxin [Epulopiscium sp.]|nr:type II toxin-antitoxin system Phd/YefM family antitoxin [Candidatus Epulonipiscium sp.]